MTNNIDLLYRDKYLLNKSSLRCIYFGYIHSYLNYANILWGSTYQTKLKSIHLLQKRAIHIMFNKDKMMHSRLLLRLLNTLNVYQINLFQHLCFMHNFNKNENPAVFNNLIKKPVQSIQQSFQKIALASKVSLSMVQNLVFLFGDRSVQQFFNKSRKRNKCLHIIFNSY